MATAVRESDSRGALLDEYEDLEDQHLLGLYLEGDQRAFRALHDRYEGRIKNFLRSRYGLSESKQEDLWQETMLRVHRHAHRYDSDVSAFSNWIYMIASNLGKNVLRSRSTHQTIDFSTYTSGSCGEKDGEDRPFEIKDISHSPEREFEKARARKLVEKSVRELRPHHRAAFLLVNLRGWSYQRTAHWLGIALGTVKSRVHRAENVFAGAFEALSEQRVTPEGGRIRVTKDGEVQWSRPEAENGASPWSVRENGNEADDGAGTNDPDEIRAALREQGWDLRDGTWRQTGNRRARVFRDEFVEEFPDLVTRWFLPE